MCSAIPKYTLTGSYTTKFDNSQHQNYKKYYYTPAHTNILRALCAFITSAAARTPAAPSSPQRSVQSLPPPPSSSSSFASEPR